MIVNHIMHYYFVMFVLFLHEIGVQPRRGIVLTSQSNNALYDLLSYVCPCQHRNIGWTHNITQNDRKIPEVKL